MSSLWSDRARPAVLKGKTWGACAQAGAKQHPRKYSQPTWKLRRTDILPRESIVSYAIIIWEQTEATGCVAWDKQVPGKGACPGGFPLKLHFFSFSFFLFACTMWHARSYFPDQVSNLGPCSGNSSPNHWVAKEFPSDSFSLRCKSHSPGLLGIQLQGPWARVS